ncbi:MAG: hypothetical protein DRJ07_09370 [Bacteroidetes bacterium]|nr:MAG: hypothetical protein DRJ07_09370 [Bacteroidota bacterium]
MNLKVILLIMVLVGFSACKTQKQTIVDPRENLKSAVTDAISLLEKEEYKPFFEKYILPKNLEMVLTMKTMDEIIESFSKKKATRLLDALKLAKEATPKYDESGNQATFAKEDIEGLSKTIIFEKVDKYWYIAN